MITPSLQRYIENRILPLYDRFDAAHRRNHAEMVIAQSMAIAENYEVNPDMVYAIAAYHDSGLLKDRRTHHLESGRLVREDMRLKEWFRDDQIEIMAQAVEDHRASSDQEPRSIYGKIVSEADRFIDPDRIIERTIQYGLEHFPELDCEEHYRRVVAHMNEKYAEGGYLKLWFPESPNAARLERLRAIIRDETLLRAKFDRIYRQLTSSGK
ncbi:MAG: HD domain-containing protein [Alistipes senegalensis]|nr:HD domain-containing protein [Bacteroides cellulosilyticus]MCM1352348.1 HD domain-containing protein [Alistipes senegalensis]